MKGQRTIQENGVYAADQDEYPRFHPLPPPDDAEVVQVAGRLAERTVAQGVVWGPTPTPKKRIHLRGMNRCWLRSPAPRWRVASPRARMPASES